jgi:hypothetical protein
MWLFSQVTSDQVVQGFGLPAAIVIIGLAAAVVYLVRRGDNLQTKLDAEKDSRLSDAKESRDKLTEPLNEQTELGKKTYDLLIELSTKRRK